MTLYECEYPGCTAKVGGKIGGKAVCLRHVMEMTTLAERRRSVGLHPDVPPPGFTYLENEDEEKKEE
jgi:hypothetical protein